MNNLSKVRRCVLTTKPSGGSSSHGFARFSSAFEGSAGFLGLALGSSCRLGCLGASTRLGCLAGSFTVGWLAVLAVLAVLVCLFLFRAWVVEGCKGCEAASSDGSEAFLRGALWQVMGGAATGT